MSQRQLMSKRIRNIKSNLENAEQSFLDNKGIRGELDLMLAEAELNNLRRKKEFPWSWNRQLLALCTAFMLLVSCFGGWHYARHYTKLNVPENKPTVSVNSQSVRAAEKKSVAEKPVVQPERHKISAVSAVKDNNKQNLISDTDMHNLVKSARAELTSAR